MPKTIDLQTQEKETPIILVCGNNILLQPRLVHLFINDFKIIHITDSVTNVNTDGKNYYKIGIDSLYLIKNLEEVINYGIIFLENQEDKKNLTHILPKIIKDKGKVVITINIRQIHEFIDVILEYKNSENISFVLSGDIYSKTILDTQISKIIQNAVLKKSVNLTGNDLVSIFPIFINDAVKGVHHILFSSQQKQKIYYLFYSHPQTIISAIHLLKRIEPELEIKYSDKKDDTGDESESRDQINENIKSKLLLKPEYLDSYFSGFEKNIRISYYEESNTNLMTEQEKHQTPKATLNKLKIKRSTKINLMIIFLCSVLLYLLIITSSIFTGLSSFRIAALSLKNGNFYSSLKTIQNSQILLSIAEPSIKLFSLSQIGNNNVNNYFAVKEAADVLNQALTDAEILRTVPKGININILEKLLSDVFYLYFRTEKLKLGNNSKIVSSLTNNEITKLLSILPVAPELFGYDKEKTYLLLFQNNGELRPTGGFIGSIGEISFLNGKITSFKIKDVYEGDGQLKAHVEPFYIVRRYLQPHLYLRDSNFNPNFETTASTSALLYSLETNKKVDGVIGIDFSVLKEILHETGPIKLSSYNKTVDENNAFDFLQTTIESNFFPGSTQKKDVLNAVFTQLAIKFEEDSKNYYKILKIIPKLLSEKNIMFSFNNASVQRIFSVSGYSASLIDLRENTDAQINDVFTLNEANIGMNKANIGVQRKVEYKTNLSNNEIKSQAIIDYINNSNFDYKTYIRILAPQGSIITGIKIDGKEQVMTKAITDFRVYEAKKFKAPSSLEVDSIKQDNLQSFGFVTTILKNSNKTIEVSYNNGLKLSGKNVFMYSLLFIKQPGVEKYPFKLRVNYASNFAPQEVENATLNKGEIVISDTIVKDKEYKIKLIKR